MSEHGCRRFELDRQEDVSGNSGTGIVAWGVELPSGRVILEWRKPWRSLGIYASIETLLDVHGHEGRTQVKWVDE